MIAYLTPWSVQRDGIYENSKIIVPVLNHHCSVNVVSLRENDGTMEYKNHLRKQIEGAEIVHIEHNFSYFNGFKNIKFLSNLLAKTKVPVVMVPNEVPTKFQMSFSLKTNFRQILLRMAARRDFSCADILLTYTSFQKCLLENLGIENAKLRVLPHHMTSPEISGDDSLNIFRTKYGVSPRRKIILIFGFLNKRKGIELALQALKSYMSSDVVLVLGGGPRVSQDEEYVDALKQIVTDMNISDRVIFTGYIPGHEVSGLFCAADLVLFPSSHSYSSGSLHKAISHEKPILAANTQTINEILTLSRSCLETFEQDNPEDMAHKLLSLLDDRTKRCELIRGSQHYKSMFTIEKRVSTYIKTYEDISGKNLRESNPTLLVDGKLQHSFQ